MDVTYVNLRDAYAIIKPRPLYNLMGSVKVNDNSEQESIFSYNSGNLFVKGNDVLSIINQNIKNYCGWYITFVLPSLTDHFLDNSEYLSEEEHVTLLELSNTSNPKFKNIYEYDYFDEIQYTLPLYQMFGVITPYNVLHISVKDFVEMINDRNAPLFVLDEIYSIIGLYYEEYDLYDKQQGKMIKRIESC